MPRPYGTSDAASLKAWIDHIVRAGKTFNYAGADVEGIAQRRNAGNDAVARLHGNRKQAQDRLRIVNGSDSEARAHGEQQNKRTRQGVVWYRRVWNRFVHGEDLQTFLLWESGISLPVPGNPCSLARLHRRRFSYR